MKRLLIGSTALVGFSVVLVGPSAADNLTWTGGGSGPGNLQFDWSNPFNWTSDTTGANVAPTYHSYNNLTFAGTKTTSIDNVAGFVDPTSITFNASAGAFYLSGHAEGVGAGGITNNSTNTQTLNFQTPQLETNTNYTYTGIVPESSQTWNAASGDIVVQSNVQNFTQANGAVTVITMAGSHNVTITGSIQEVIPVGTTATSGARIQIVQGGTGTLSLQNTNTFTGGLVINSGTVSLDHATGTVIDAGGAASNIITINSGTLRSSETGTLSNQINMSAAGTHTIAEATGQTLTLASPIAYGGAVHFGSSTDAGTIVLTGASGAAGTAVQAGTTISIDDGTVRLGGGNTQFATAVALATSTSVNNSATLDLAGFGLSIGNLQGTSATATIATGTAGGNTLTVGQGSFAGAITGAGQLLKQSSGAADGGTLTLTGTSSYSGETDLQVGTIAVGNNKALGDGTLLFDGGAGVLQAAANNLNVTNAAQINVGGTIDANGKTFTYSGAIADGASSGALTVVDSLANGGVVRFGGGNTYTGLTTVTSGTLALIGTGSIATSSGVADNATFDISGLTGAGTSIKSLSGTGALALGTKTLTITAAGAASSGVFAGTSTGTGGITVAGGTERFSTAQGYTGATTTSAGATLALTGAGNVSASSGVVDNGTFDVSGLTLANTSVQSLSGTGTLVLGGTTLSVTAAGTAGPGTFAGTSSGTGGFTVAGGTQTFASAQGYTGATTIAAGAGLSLALAGDISPSAGVIDNGTFDVSGVTPATATVQSLSGTGTLTLGAKTLAITAAGVNASGVFGGTSSGTGGLTVAGGTETLTSRQGYTGLTTITAGTLALVGAGNIAASSGLLANGTFDVSAVDGAATTVRTLSGTGTVALGGTTLSLAAAADTFAGTINGTGGLTLVSGTETLTGNNTYTGTTTITTGTLNLGNGGAGGAVAGPIVDNGALVFNRTADLVVAGAISGTGTVTKRNVNTLELDGANSYAGGTVFKAGTLTIGNNAALGTGTLTMDSGTTLAFAGNYTVANSIVFTGTNDPTFDTGANTDTLSGPISGPDSLTKTGTGTLNLTGVNTYTGGTNIAAGTLVGATTAFGSGPILDNGALVIDQPTNVDFATVISGAGTVTKTGAGQLDLTGTNTYTGATTVAAGTLLVDGSVGASAVTVENGATLGGRGTLGSLTAVAGSTVAPGLVTPYTTLTVNGTVAFNAGSTYTTNVNPAVLTDLITAGGTATLTGGTVNVLAANGTYANRTRYTILTAAGGVDGTFAGAVSNLAFLTPTLTYDANDAFLILTRNDLTFAPLTNTPNQGATARASDPVFRLGTALYEALLTLPPGQIPAAFNALSGEAHASAVTALFEDTRLVRNSILDRLRDTGCGFGLVDPRGASIYSPTPVASCAPPQRFTAWGTGFGDWGRNGGNGNAATLNRSTGGFVLGGDTLVDGPYFNNWRFGVVGGYTNDSIDVKQRASSGSVESYFGGLYAGAQYGLIDIRLGGTFGGTSTRLDRTIAFPGFLESAHSNYGGDIFQGFGEVGYRVPLARGFLEPIFQGAAIHIDQDGFRERGQTVALQGFSRGYDLETTTLGVRAESTPFANLPIIARAMLGWRHAYGDVNPAALLAFEAGSSAFTVTGAPIDRDALVAEIGLDYQTGPWTVGIDYEGQYGSRADDSAVKGRAEYRF